MSEAKRTQGAFNEALREVCDTFEVEKFPEEQQKAMDLFLMGKMSLFHCIGIANRALFSLHHH